MGIKFIWKDEYSVGVAELDRQHQKMFALGNEIQGLEVSNSKKTILELYRYTREHFAREERHMKEIGYPDLVHHRDLHEQLIADLNKRVEKQIDTQEKLNDFVLFVYNWIVDHILNQDKKYFEFAGKA